MGGHDIGFCRGLGAGGQGDYRAIKSEGRLQKAESSEQRAKGKMKKINYGDKKLKESARGLHALWWFREARGRERKRIMIREWNALYPSAPITLKQMYWIPAFAGMTGGGSGDC